MSNSAEASRARVFLQGLEEIQERGSSRTLPSGEAFPRASILRASLPRLTRQKKETETDRGREGDRAADPPINRNSKKKRQRKSETSRTLLNTVKMIPRVELCTHTHTQNGAVCFPRAVSLSGTMDTGARASLVGCSLQLQLCKNSHTLSPPQVWRLL